MTSPERTGYCSEPNRKVASPLRITKSSSLTWWTWSGNALFPGDSTVSRQPSLVAPSGAAIGAKRASNPGLGFLRVLRHQLDVIDVDERTLRHLCAPSEVNRDPRVHGPVSIIFRFFVSEATRPERHQGKTQRFRRVDVGANITGT